MNIKTFSDYLAYLFQPSKMLMMALVALIAIGVSLVLIMIKARLAARTQTEKKRGAYMRYKISSATEKFYELIFSSTFILMFVSIYFAIDYFGFGNSNNAIWQKYNGIILLVFILLSVVLNSFVDNKIIPLDHIHPGERAAMRLLGMVYMLVIFAYIKFMYQDDNYDSIIMYFITLIIGRFVYFDASLESFKEAMEGAKDNLPLLLLALMCTGLMALYGFSSGYLLKQYGVVLNLFYAHLYLLIIIFIIHHLNRRNDIVSSMVDKIQPDNENAPDERYHYRHAKRK